MVQGRPWKRQRCLRNLNNIRAQMVNAHMHMHALHGNLRRKIEVYIHMYSLFVPIWEFYKKGKFETWKKLKILKEINNNEKGGVGVYIIYICMYLEFQRLNPSNSCWISRESWYVYKNLSSHWLLNSKQKTQDGWS